MNLKQGTLEQPSSFWRSLSSVTVYEITALCRAFLSFANTTEVNGQESFIKLLESRADYKSRTRGLITGIVYTHHDQNRIMNYHELVVVANCLLC